MPACTVISCDWQQPETSAPKEQAKEFISLITCKRCKVFRRCQAELTKGRMLANGQYFCHGVAGSFIPSSAAADLDGRAISAAGGCPWSVRDCFIVLELHTPPGDTTCRACIEAVTSDATTCPGPRERLSGVRWPCTMPGDAGNEETRELLADGPGRSGLEGDLSSLMGEVGSEPPPVVTEASSGRAGQLPGIEDGVEGDDSESKSGGILMRSSPGDVRRPSL